MVAVANAAILCAPVAVTAPSVLGRRDRRRTFISSTDVLDDVYRPAFPVESRYRSYFEPTMVTDEKGGLAEALADDLATC